MIILTEDDCTSTVKLRMQFDLQLSQEYQVLQLRIYIQIMAKVSDALILSQVVMERCELNDLHCLSTPLIATGALLKMI